MRELCLAVLLGLAGTLFMATGRTANTDSKGPFLLVANKSDATLGIIDPEAGREIATIPDGGVTGHELVASAEGRRVFVPIYGNSGVGLAGTDGREIAVMDLAARKVVGHIDFARGVRPHCAILNPRDGLLYVTTELDNAIALIDPRTLKIVGSIPTGRPQSHMLAISHDGRRGYTANVASGTVSVLEIKARKLITVIPVAAQVQRISVSTDDRMVFTSDQTKPRLAVIDTATDTVKTWVVLPGTGYGSAPTPDGKWLVIALPDTNKVGVIDLAAMKVAHTIDVPPSPQEVLVQPDGKVAYVSCDASRKIAAIRTSDWHVEKLIDAGKGIDGLAWASAK